MGTVHVEWGLTGALAAAAPLTVVVDVLSFTTTLSVAVERGMTVYPYRWKDERAAAYAAERDAVLARGRSERTGVSLSPATVRAAEGVDRLVLPSPNGSAISFGLADAGVTVVGAALRNATAVARWVGARWIDAHGVDAHRVDAHRAADGRSDVAVVAAGERWPDGSLRPAVEDLWGAGAVIAGLVDLVDGGALGDGGALDLTPEARAAEQAFRAARFPDDLVACASGQELVEMGFREDVAIAAEVDASTVVPVLGGAAYRAG